ncbi:MAG: acetolactate synthase small subunit [Clostridiales bacterium]|jgi:acetolactate synthase-1/3 small subunit|nr:acetolactate synthase small subunit [Clostridiales bacterium]
MRHVLSMLVSNQAGVLSRVTGLFSRRGYNIDSLSVGTAEDSKYSRITVVAQGDDAIIEQIQKQVGKLEDVREVTELLPEAAICRELCFIKVAADARTRPEVYSVVDIFRANIIDVSVSTLTVEITGDQSKLSAFTELMEPYGILEIVRTGLTAIARGGKT